MNSERPPSSTDSPVDVVSEFRRKLDQAAKTQASLAEARVDLLVERESLRTQRKRVREQRDTTRDAENAFIKSCRIFFEERGNALPAALTSTFDTYSQEYDRLGSVENDYFEADEALGAQEWTFMDKENDFYQYEAPELFPQEFFENLEKYERISPFSSHTNDTSKSQNPPPAQYTDVLMEHYILKEEFNALRPQQAQLIEVQETRDWNILGGFRICEKSLGSTGFRRRKSDLLDQLATSEAVLSRLRFQDIRRHHDYLNPYTLRYKPPSFSVDWLKDSVTIDPPTQSPINDRLNFWLLDIFKDSTLERLRYVIVLEHELQDNGFLMPDAESWEDGAVEYWFADGTGQYLLHDQEHSSVAYSLDQRMYRKDEIVSQPTSAIVLQEQEEVRAEEHISNTEDKSSPQTIMDSNLADQALDRKLPAIEYVPETITEPLPETITTDSTVIMAAPQLDTTPILVHQPAPDGSTIEAAVTKTSAESDQEENVVVQPIRLTRSPEPPIGDTTQSHRPDQELVFGQHPKQGDTEVRIVLLEPFPAPSEYHKVLPEGANNTLLEIGTTARSIASVAEPHPPALRASQEYLQTPQLEPPDRYDSAQESENEQPDRIRETPTDPGRSGFQMSEAGAPSLCSLFCS